VIGDSLGYVLLSIRESLEAVCAEELLAKMHEEGVVVLDVRPEEEYGAGHIPGARSVPVERLEGVMFYSSDPATPGYVLTPEGTTVRKPAHDDD